MMSNDLDRIGRYFSELSGIKFNAKSGRKEGYEFIDFHPEEPEYPTGFSVRIHLFWQRFEMSFIPDNFAGPLLVEMGHSKDGRKTFTNFARSICTDHGILNMQINGKPIDPLNPESWETEWKQLDIKLEKFCADGNLTDFSSAKSLLLDWGGRFLCMVISLLSLEEISENESNDIDGLPEGAKSIIMVNRYERNPVNRVACIVKHGCYCHVCGIKFNEIYGEIGEGFIHIHHVIPVYKMGEGYVVDPEIDMIPLCPNCHSMIHRRNPPLTVDELIKLFRKAC